MIRISSNKHWPENQQTIINVICSVSFITLRVDVSDKWIYGSYTKPIKKNTNRMSIGRSTEIDAKKKASPNHSQQKREGRQFSVTYSSSFLFVCCCDREIHECVIHECARETERKRELWLQNKSKGRRINAKRNVTHWFRTHKSTIVA